MEGDQILHDREDNSGLEEASEYEEVETSLPDSIPPEPLLIEQSATDESATDKSAPYQSGMEDELVDEADLPQSRENYHAVQPAPYFALLGFWAVSSLLAYSIAGEKMPWLTVHIALPAILCAAWTLGRTVDATDWGLLRDRRAGWRWSSCRSSLSVW